MGQRGPSSATALEDANNLGITRPSKHPVGHEVLERISHPILDGGFHLVKTFSFQPVTPCDSGRPNRICGAAICGAIHMIAFLNRPIRTGQQKSTINQSPARRTAHTSARVSEVFGRRGPQ